MVDCSNSINIFLYFITITDNTKVKNINLVEGSIIKLDSNFTLTINL